MNSTYKINIAGIERDLPRCKLNDTTDIAAFVIFSDVELTIHVCKELLKKVPDFDCIITAESKGIPLAYEMARQSGKTYVVARKSVKLYMTNSIEVSVKSITTDHMQKLYLSEEKANLIKGKKILILDDVISTGESLKALELLTQRAGGIISAKAAVLAEGEAADRKDIIFLEKLPLIKRT